MTMTWTDHAIFWQVYPLGFTGAPVRGEEAAAALAPGATPYPRLLHLADWVEYAVQLGVNGLLLGPIFASSTHGYDTLDHLRIDPRLGTEEDFATLVGRCQAAGMRIVLDGVFSHVGSRHPAFRAALEGGPDSPEAQLFAIDWEAEGGPAPRVFEGHGELVRLDHASPAAQTLITDAMTHWLERGADGWRLDAAYSIASQHWAQILSPVREAHPEAWILGEVIHGDYPQVVAESGMDSVTQYHLWKGIWSSLLDRNFYELDHALGEHAAYLESFVPQTFVGNHDVTRIASRVGQDGAVLALVVLLTVGGMPSVYYGDEQGLEGVKEEREGGDDEVRPRYPRKPHELASFGEPVRQAHQDLIGIRRRHPWLVRANTETVELSNERYVYRTVGDGQGLEVELDLQDGHRARVRGAEGQELWAWG